MTRTSVCLKVGVAGGGESGVEFMGSWAECLERNIGRSRRKIHPGGAYEQGATGRGGSRLAYIESGPTRRFTHVPPVPRGLRP